MTHEALPLSTRPVKRRAIIPALPRAPPACGHEPRATPGAGASAISARVIRDSVLVYTGKLGSLRRFKDDVREVQQGYECGMSIEGYLDIKVGDVIESYEVEEIAPTLA